MALQSTPCVCTARVLALFVRRVAQIDLLPPRKATSTIESLYGAKRNLNTRYPLQLHGKSNYDNTNTAIYAAADLTDSIPFDRGRSARESGTSEDAVRPSKSSAVGNTAPRRWTPNKSAKKNDSSAGDSLPTNVTYSIRRADFNENTSALSQIMHMENEEAPFLELNTETIDALAAKSSMESFYAKQEPAKERQTIRPKQPQAFRNGFRLHYSSPPVAPIPTARGIKRQDHILSEPKMSQSRNAVHHPSHRTERESWQIQKAALKEKFKEGWNPRKRLSPDALAGIRAIHAQFPEQYTTSVLAEKFEVSPEAVRRILKSNWTPKEEEALDRQRRWFLRGQKVWSRYAELGLKPPARWRRLGIGKGVDLAAGRGEERDVGTTITTRNSNHAVQEVEENFSSIQTNMDERIL